MPLPLLPLVVGSLVAAAYHKTYQTGKGPPKGVLTPERQMIFETAIKEMREPEKLRILAKTYREQGLPAQADMLEKRANLRALPKEVTQARRTAYKRAMKSTNVNAIRGLANAYEREGATGAAQSLREYAASIPSSATPAEVIPVQASPPPAAPSPPPMPIPPPISTVNVTGEDMPDEDDESEGDINGDENYDIPDLTDDETLPEEY